MKLRKYQQEAVDAVVRELEAGHQVVLVVVPTGGGKTVIAGAVANLLKERGRIMVLAHRDELLRQAGDKFQTMTGLVPVFEKADERSEEDSMHGKPPLVISSFQTQISGRGDKKRMHKFDPNEFAFLWSDEAHHLPAPSYRSVFDYYIANPDLKCLLVTATPDRSDGESLGQVCQSVAYEYTIRQAIDDGYLVPIHTRAVAIEGMDFSKVRTTAGDLNAGDLEAVMIFEKPLHGVVHATIEIACGLEQGTLREIEKQVESLGLDGDESADRRRQLLGEKIAGKHILRTLLFAVSVVHSTRMAEIFERWIPESAGHVDGKFDIDDRRQVFTDFESGKIHFLSNVGIASEGFDAPHIELVVMSRPTKSRALYAQQAGRATRPAPEIAHDLGDDTVRNRELIATSKKPQCVVLDFVGNSGKHKLITAIDILGDMHESEVVERAKELAQESGVSVTEALEESEADIEGEREINRIAAELAQDDADEIEQQEAEKRERDRRAGLVGTADYFTKTVNPFDDYALAPARDEGVKRIGGASDAQISALENLGVARATAQMYSKSQAGAVISSLRAKRCTDGQSRCLKRAGYAESEVAAMNFEAAGNAITELKANGWRKPAQEAMA